MTKEQINKIDEELEDLKCGDAAIYKGTVQQVCSGRDTDECCHNEQTYEEAMAELKTFLHSKLQEAYELGKRDGVESINENEADYKFY